MNFAAGFIAGGILGGCICFIIAAMLCAGMEG
jgi:hypothetical protein